MSIFLFLASLISVAFAGDKTFLPLPTVGATATISDCTMKIVASPWNTKHAGELVIDEARAQVICMEAEGDLVVARAKAQAIVTRSVAEASLITDAGAAAKSGGSVTYESNGTTVKLATGPAAEWSAYGQAVSTGDSRLYAPGMIPAGGDPNLWRLSGGATGYLVGAIPAMPGQPVADSASAALGTCKSALATTSKRLEACSGN